MPKPTRRTSRAAGVLATLAFGALLAFLALPHALAALSALVGEQAMLSVADGRPLTLAGYERARSSRTKAAARADAPRWQLDLARIDLAEAYEAGFASARGRPGIAMARDHILAALRGRPANHLAWHYLAYVELAAGNRGAAVQAWRRSLGDGPFDPALCAARTRLGLRLLPEFDGPGLALLNRQIACLARREPPVLVAIADELRAWPYLATLHPDDPFAAKNLRRMLGRYIARSAAASLAAPASAPGSS